MSMCWRCFLRIPPRRVYSRLTELTLGIILIGEVGGKDEFKALEYIKQTNLDQKKW